jgi:hypothetical protein
MKEIIYPDILVEISVGMDLSSTLECPVEDPADLLPYDMWYIIADNIEDISSFRSIALVSKVSFRACIEQYKKIISKYDKIAIYDGTYYKKPMFYLNNSEVEGISNRRYSISENIIEYHGLVTRDFLKNETKRQRGKYNPTPIMWVDNGPKLI